MAGDPQDDVAPGGLGDDDSEPSWWGAARAWAPACRAEAPSPNPSWPRGGGAPMGDED